MLSSRTARKIIGVVGAAAVSTVLLGGTVAATSSDDAGRGIRPSAVTLDGRGI